MPSFKGVLVTLWDLRNWNWGRARELGKLNVALFRNFHLLLDLVLKTVLAHFRSLDSIVDDCVALPPLKFFRLGIASRMPSFKGIAVACWQFRDRRLARELWRVIVALCRKLHLLLDLVLDVVLSHLRSLDGIVENGVCLTPLKIFRLDFGSFIPFLNWDLVWLRWLRARNLGRGRVVDKWDFLTPHKIFRLYFGSFTPFFNWDLVRLCWLWARELGRDRVVDDWEFLMLVKCVRFVSDTVVRCFREVVANRDVLVIYCTIGNGSSNSLSLLAEL
jgi:hypothetical protein